MTALETPNSTVAYVPGLTGYSDEASAARRLGGAKTTAGASQRSETLRQRVGEFVGNVFYGTLMREMQQSSLKGAYFHGGRGEEAFQGQLGLELAQRMGRAPGDPVADAIYRSLARRAGLSDQRGSSTVEGQS